MKYTIEDFVGVFDGAFSDEYCDNVVKLFGNAEKAGFSVNRKLSEGAPESIKKDEQLMPDAVIRADILSEEYAQFVDTFWKYIYKTYADTFSVLENCDNHQIYYSKIQKTNIGGGYHVWHCENASKESNQRVLAYILYLNDVDDGGETEFLYLHKRYRPKKGTLVLFPAGFTHTHRGNPPLSNTKYIMTGWVEY